MATETIINYVKACTDAFLFYQVKRQDIQGKKLLAINENIMSLTMASAKQSSAAT